MLHRHFLVHKPYGYLSQFMSNNAREARKKRFLGELHDFPEGTMSIGRLDEHSEGLLLLTTDGSVSEQIRRKDVEKEYYAQVDGLITDEAVTQLQQGVEIGLPDGKYQPTGQSPFPLTPVGKDAFTFDGAGVRMEFAPASQHRCSFISGQPSLATNSRAICRGSKGGLAIIACGKHRRRKKKKRFIE